MGGIGMLGGPGLELPYPWIMRSCVSIHGSWLAPASANARIVALVKAGRLDLSGHATTEFPLAAVNDAVAHAAANGGPFKMTVLRP